MPALQRTPPQRVNRSPIKAVDSTIQSPTAATNAAAGPSSLSTLPQGPSRVSEGNTTLPSPSRAFAPRNQRVMRTPPGGAAPSGTGAGQMLPPASPLPAPGSTATPSPLRRSPRTARASAAAPEVPTSAGVDAAGSMEELRQDEEAFVEEQILAGISTVPQPPIAATETASTTPTKSPKRGTGRASVSALAAAETATTAPVPADAIAEPAAGSSSAAAEASTTPANPPPRTPRTRRSVAPDPLVAQPMQMMDVEEGSAWGKRYGATQDALELAISKAARKWTRRDLEGIFPLLSAKFPDEIKSIHTEAAAKMSQHIESAAQSHFEHYKIGRATQMLDQVVKEANEHAAKSSESRPDAWRPDLSPEALTAAANLGMYDETYDRLRAEYLALHADCSTRYASIQAKQAELAALENSVSDGVIELDRTLAALDGFPTGEMKDWAETAMGKMEGGRVAERA